MAERLTDCQGAPAAVQTPAGALDNFLYYYHPDHLGSSSYVTDATGKLYQHMEYFPFGETWVDERSNTQRTPYLFTGKEFDEETGLYYYGARYFDPRTSVWQSPDPIMSSYLDGKPNSGVYDSRNLNLLAYGYQNPLRFRDIGGLCNDPNPEGSGTRYCVDLFIPRKSEMGFRGDDRGPSAKGGTNRGEMAIFQDEKGKWQKKEIPGISEFLLAGTKGPGKGGGSTLAVSEGNDGRKIKASMRAGNDVFGRLTLGVIKAPMAGFDLTINEDSQGNASVDGSHTRGNPAMHLIK